MSNAARAALTPTPRLDVGGRLRARAWALLPAVVVQAALLRMAFLPVLALALGSALLFEALARLARGEPPGSVLAQPWAIGHVLLIALLLPAGTPPWLVVAAVLTAVALGHASGGSTQTLFNPAMAGLALVALLRPGSTSEPLPALLALAFVAGGAWLLRRGVIRWQAPAGLLAGVALAGLGTGSLAWLPAQAALLVAAALFVACDHAGGCSTRRGRLLSCVLAGVALVLLQRWHAAPFALAFAILMMNCAAPWIDDLLDRPRRAATESGHDP